MTSPRPSPVPRDERITRTAPADTGRTVADRAPRVPATARRPLSWGRALILMCAFAAVLWAVQIVNANLHYRLDRFGLLPRTRRGLWGVLTEPFLHADYRHLLSNTLPVVLIGWVVMIAGVRLWAVVTATVVIGGGLLTWALGPADSLIVGASGLVFGWLGYLLARAVFSRRLRWIAVAAAVLFFFGTLLVGLFPTLDTQTSWQAHACGFAAGVVAAAALHPRGGDIRRLRRPAVS